MYKLLIFLLSFLFINNLQSQVEDNYFQQKVDYDIQATLDDSLHYLTGFVDIKYINNSPDTLEGIYLHLWPNAYRNRQTAFAKQQIENGDVDFYFAPSQHLGGYKDIEVKVDEKVVEWDYWEDQFDIAYITLSKPLNAGDSLTINTSFRLKIPHSYSRLGHVGQSYQMTQWYPKPAVYDKNGWHPMPYLDQGEFYSEFGNFDVEITLPKNYVVGATGELQTTSEIEFLNQKIEETQKKKKNKEFLEKKKENDFPVSSPTMKTINYKATNVHDFAWFADKRFYVDKSEVVLPSGKKIDTYTMFTNEEAELWADAIDYVDRSVLFYSERVGEYPYPHATAIQSALSAGAGMEYPMITVIGLAGSAESLDEVITHEVGHNWFYGILATNERDYAWLDEGFNSYYEHEYMEKYYDSKGSYLGYEKLVGVPANEANQLTFYLPMRRHTDQAINTPSQDLRLFNYWTGAYEKPAYLLEYLENYLGTDEFNRVMQTYYDTWKFKHPQPEDAKALFEKETGKDLSWFFDGLINTTDPLDYKVQSIEKNNGGYDITVINKGEINAPFPIDAIEEGRIIKTVWSEGFEGEKIIRIPINAGEKFVVDDQKIMPDFNRKNNSITAKGKKMEPLQFKFLAGVENPDKTTVYWTPTIAVNKYDGFQLGMALYNTALPSKKLEWVLAPFFGFRSKDINGLAHIRYNMYPEKLQRLSVGLGYKGFSYWENDFYEQFNATKDFDYYRVRPYIELELNKNNARSRTQQIFTIQTLLINQQVTGTLSQEIVGADTSLVYTGHQNEFIVVPQVKYNIENTDAIQPFSIEIALEGQQYKTRPAEENAAYLKTTIDAAYRFNYKKKKGIHLRTYIGAFIFNTQKNAGGVSNLNFARSSLSLISQGFSDPWFDDFYRGRSEGEGFLSQQIHTNQGGFKTPTSGVQGLGQSNSFVAALNIKIDLPMNFPSYIPAIRPYLDLGYFKDSRPTAIDATFNEGLIASGGIALEFLDGRIGVYLPLFGTDNVQNILKQKGKYFSRIAFSVDLNRLNPFKYAYNFDL